MNSFFDGYIHSKTTLKEFAGQYDNASCNKAQKEDEKDARSFNVQVKNVSPYDFENQFQEAYTIGKCKDFLTQLAGKIACTLIAVKTIDRISKFEIEEDIKCGEIEYLKTVTFHVRFNKASIESSCTCRLLECKGIVCKHILMVWTKEKLNRVSEKYVLRRWRKNVRRSHTNVKISYVNGERKPEWRRFDMLMTVFHEAADNATYSDAKSARVVAKLREVIAEIEVCDDECPMPLMPIYVQDSSVSPKDKRKPIGDPNKPHRRGQPPINRKQPRIEKIIKKVRESSNKIQCHRANAKNRLALVDERDVGVATQESVNFGASFRNWWFRFLKLLGGAFSVCCSYFACSEFAICGTSF
ncbi:protein FAR1-RELATED SEQUENCE 1-like [Rhododendron vialii]|uniref:protein FAR1-RELATED SEQUENCE 1-like n=1 Tax=Rhododendron vialii TaxID=182163 RepID=UPI00265ED451|nr:protein FAR1-RELATED SEQUENCE 1-like [Rhododendron vialii]